MTDTPFGRYTGRDDGEPRQVRLLNLPVRVMVAGRERHDELMREFALLAMSGEPRSGTPARLIALTETLGVRFAAASERPDAAVDAALAEGRDTVDLSYTVTPDVLRAADLLEQLMAEADDFCVSEDLLTLGRTELQKRFGEWYLDEFRRQLAGEPPTPWDGPLDPD